MSFAILSHPVLAQISGSSIVHVLLWLIIMGVIFGLLWWLVDYCMSHEPSAQEAQETLTSSWFARLEELERRLNHICKHPPEDALNTLGHTLRKVEHLLHEINERRKRMAISLDDLIADATEESTVIQSVVDLLTSISAQLKAAGTDPTKLQALKDLIDKNKKAAADAVVANTPAAE